METEAHRDTRTGTQTFIFQLAYFCPWLNPYIRLSANGGSSSASIAYRSGRSLCSCPIAYRLSLRLLLAPAAEMTADPWITEMLKNLDRDEGRFVSVIDDILEKLEEQKMVYRMRIPPRRVGTDKANRGGYGISAIEVHALGDDIFRMGWSKAATAHAVCCEDDEQKSHAAFTVELQETSPGLGNRTASEIGFASLSCSHTNAFLVAALCEVECEFPALCIGNRMSPAKLSNDAKLADAMENGLTWLVLKKEVRMLYPELTDFVQAAKNAPGHVQRRETEMQFLVKVQSMVTAQSKMNNGSVNFAAIESTIRKRCTVDESDLPHYIKWVQLYGGGDSGTFVKELDAFHKVHVPTGRVIPSSTFQAIADLKLQPSEMCPFMASAIVKAQGACPPAKAPNKICKYISSADIGLCADKRKPQMLEAEQTMVQMRALVRDKLRPEAATRLLGKFDCLMARWVLKKEERFERAASIAWVSLSEINEHLVESGASPVSSPWSDPWAEAGKGDKDDASHADGSGKNIVQYDAAGKAVQLHSTVLTASGLSR